MGVIYDGQKTRLEAALDAYREVAAMPGPEGNLEDAIQAAIDAADAWRDANLAAIESCKGRPAVSASSRP